MLGTAVCAIRRRGIEELHAGISFGSIFLLFRMKVAGYHVDSSGGGVGGVTLALGLP